jgi:hypothetical protein
MNNGVVKRRRHGLEWPLNIHQLAALILLTFLLVGTYTLLLPFTPEPPAKWGLMASYTLLAFIALFMGILAA